MGHAAAEAFQCCSGAQKGIRVTADQHGQFAGPGLRSGPADRTIEQVDADARQFLISEFLLGEREGSKVSNDQAASPVRCNGCQ